MRHNVFGASFAAKARAIYDLVKPELPLAAGICVVAGEVIASETVPSAFVGLMGFFTGFFISGVAMITNDYFDLDVDRVNHPERPLPSGRVSSTELMILACLFSVVGFIAAALLGPLALALAAVMWTVSNLYNWRYKETGLSGNMMVGLCLAMLFILGGVAMGRLDNPMIWTFCALVFIFDLGEEIAGGVMDMEGDRKRSARSMALLYGRKNALRVSSLLFALFVAISFLPFMMGWLGSISLVIFVPMDLAILYFAFKLKTSQTIEEGRTGIRQLYLSTTIFVMAFTVISLL